MRHGHEAGEVTFGGRRVGIERQFRRIIGCQQLATLAVAIERDLAPPMTTKEAATLVTA